MREVHVYDTIVILGLIMILTCHTLTSWYINRTSQETGANINATIQYYEVNPVASLILKVQSLRLIYSYLVVPAMILGAYYYVRRKYGTTDVWIVGHLAIIFFVIALLNATNDIVVYLARFLT